MYLADITTNRSLRYTIGDMHHFQRYKKITILLTIMCGALIAFRSKDVGIDTMSYLESLYESSFKSVKNYSYIFDIRHTEIGYIFITYILNSSGFKQGLFVLEALAIMIPLYLFIKRNSANPYLSFLFFISLDYFGFALTGLRQTLAIGAVLMVINSLEKDNLKWAIMYIVIAISIHTSSLIAVPILFIKKIPLNRFMFSVAILLALAVISLKVLLMSFIQDFGLHEESVGSVETGGTGYYYFLLSIVFLIFLQKSKVRFKAVKEDFLYWMIIASVIMYPGLQFNPTMFRLHYYYSIATIVVLPNLFNYFGGRGKILSLVYVAMAIYYFAYVPLSVMGIVPYQFFFE